MGGGEEGGGTVRPTAAKVALVEAVAVGRMARGAGRAGFAVGEGEQNLVAGGDVGYGGACGENDARACNGYKIDRVSQLLQLLVIRCCTKLEKGGLVPS